MSGIIAYSVIGGISVAAATAFLVMYYSRPGTPKLVYFCTYFSWLTTFAICFILPLDLSPHADKGGLKVAWRAMYWSSFLMNFIVIPMLQGYYDAGDFTVRRRILSSLRFNLVLYGVAGLAALIFITYFAIKNELTWSVTVGFTICIANAFGLFLSVFLLGYGLVEVPREIWHSADRSRTLSHLLYQLANINTEAIEIRQELWQTYRLFDNIKPRLPRATLYRDRWEEIVALLPEEQYIEDMPIRRAAGVDTLPIVKTLENKEVTMEGLVKLNFHVKALNRNLWVVDGLYRDTLEKVMKMDDLLAKQNAIAGVDWSAGLLTALNHGLTVVWKPKMLHAWAAFCMAMSLVLIWCEVTILVNVDLSIVSALIRGVESSPFFVQMFTLLFLCYLTWCACYGLFSVRLSRYYMMNKHRRTDENSLLLNASFLLRVAAPLAFNFGELLRIDDAAFQSVIGQMSVVPFFGTSFNRVFPITIGVIALLTYLNLFGRFMRWVGVGRFEYEEGNGESDDMIAEGQMILRKERRKRGVRSEPSSILLQTI